MLWSLSAKPADTGRPHRHIDRAEDFSLELGSTGDSSGGPWRSPRRDFERHPERWACDRVAADRDTENEIFVACRPNLNQACFEDQHSCPPMRARLYVHSRRGLSRTMPDV